MVGFIWFLYKYYNRFTIRHIPKFWPLKNFFGELLLKKIQFSRFLEGKGFIFASYLHSKLRNANDFALTDRTQFNWPACSEKFYHNFFRSVFAKKSWKFWVFRTDSTIPFAHCVSPLWRFFFPETHVSDPFAYCLAVMTRSYLIGAENLGWRNFFAGEFLAKTYENPGFFRGHNCYFVPIQTHAYPELSARIVPTRSQLTTFYFAKVFWKIVCYTFDQHPSILLIEEVFWKQKSSMFFFASEFWQAENAMNKALGFQTDIIS